MSSANFRMDSTLGQPSPLMPSDTPPCSANFVLSPGFWYTIDVILSCVESFRMKLPEGWSMISLPYLPEGTSIQEVFPGATVIYRYERETGYVSMTDLQTYAGYWIFLNQEKEFTINGQLVNGYDLAVNEPGWKMIGGCTFKEKAASKNCDIGVIYGYEEGVGYQRIQVTENLEPGEGYWILLNNIVGECRLTVGNPGPDL